MKEVCKRILPVLLLAGFLIAALVIGPQGKTQQTAKPGSPLTADAFLLDTFCSLTLYDGSEAALGSALALLEQFDELWNQSKETSDIYRINHRSSDVVEIHPQTAALLRWAKAYEEQAGGDFDVSIAPLSALWDTQHRTKVPSEAEIEEARSKLAFDAWSVEGETFRAAKQTLQLDVGAFAKGYIADRLKEDLEANGVSSAVINLGGNVLCIGEEAPGKPFRIGLKKPERGSESYLKVLEINGLSVVTAGIYERYFEQDGVIYHHILDPKTGWPVQNTLAAVTVLGPESAACDALSTTVFIKGEEAGTAFLSDWNRTVKAQAEKQEDPYYAYFIHRDGSLSWTAGAEQFFRE